MVVVVASEGYDTPRAAHTGPKKVNHCSQCIQWWNQTQSDELQDHYNQLMQDAVESLDSSGSLKQVFFYRNSVKTSRTPDQDFFLHPDGTHKLMHNCGHCDCRGNCDFKLPDSLVADTEMFVNLFCNHRMVYKIPKTDNLCCK